MNQSCTFYIVRHAQSVTNAQGIRAGQMNFDLSEEGIQQAQDLAKSLQAVNFDFIYSSDDLLRAKRTAEIAAAERKLKVIATKQLRERAWGKELEGEEVAKTRAMLQDWEALSYKDRYKIKPFPDTESDEELMARFTTFLREVAIGNPGKTVLLVTHGNLMRTFMVHLGMGAPQEFPRETLKTTGYLVVKSDGVDFEIVQTVGVGEKTGIK